MVSIYLSPALIQQLLRGLQQIGGQTPQPLTSTGKQKQLKCCV
jgi:hypothetical protein